MPLIKADNFSECASRALVARLCLDYTDEASFIVIRILRDAGFRVSTTLVTGLIEPELMLGSRSYRGISAIRKVAEEEAGCTV